MQKTAHPSGCAVFLRPHPSWPCGQSTFPIGDGIDKESELLPQSQTASNSVWIHARPPESVFCGLTVMPKPSPSEKDLPQPGKDGRRPKKGNGCHAPRRYIISKSCSYVPARADYIQVWPGAPPSAQPD